MGLYKRLSRTVPDMVGDWEELPADVLATVFCLLAPQDKANLRLVCKAWASEGAQAVQSVTKGGQQSESYQASQLSHQPVKRRDWQKAKADAAPWAQVCSLSSQSFN